MKHSRQFIAIVLLIASIGFNCWLYRMEPTAPIDPNDNAFQYALVKRTNDMWEFASRVCPKTITYPLCHLSYVTDHWVPNWAQGYNLPYYYSHIPQILIVASYRLFHLPISLFTYYHYVIYLILCLFPLSVFLAFKILRYPWITAGIGALLASLISTDGLYGIDQTSFLWRGWGLSSQLFALFWLPLAIASTVRYVTIQEDDNHHVRTLATTIILLVATTSGHLGIGMMAFLGVGCISLSPALYLILTHRPFRHVVQEIIRGIRNTAVVAVPAIVLLSYWIVPTMINNRFHNISFWDPVWKFNSFGAIEVITKFVNGDLFDFGRLPLYTAFIVVGLLASTQKKQSTTTTTDTPTAWPVAVLFVLFLLLFFGNTTWGSLLSLIPGMSEFHGHRFLVGLHLTGLFLAPLGFVSIASYLQRVGKRIPVHSTVKSALIVIGMLLAAGSILLPHLVSYATYNNTLITQANSAYATAKDDANTLLTTVENLIATTPGRVYALRGTEGKEFRIASTPYYMYLSTFGIPTVLWLPETWSLNSDTEQFFSEQEQSHYDLYTIRYVVAPPSKTPQPFWKTIKETPSWVLYEVSPSSTTHEGYIATGRAPSHVTSSKQTLINLVHLYLQSTYPKQHVYPELVVNEQATTVRSSSSLPHFAMTDLVTYQTPDGKFHNLFLEQPVYPTEQTPPPMRITKTTVDTDMVFSTHVDVTSPCPTCVVILKQTYHPNWHATINGKPTETLSVFPSFTAVRIESPGSYDIVFSYTPAPTKLLLWLGALVMIVGWIVMMKRTRIS